MSNAGIVTEKGDVQATGTMTDNRVIRGDGTTRIQDSGVTLDDLDNMSGVNTLAVTDAATTRTNLGLGSIATQDSNNVTITGGSVTNITDIAVADGGTGASTAADARTNLGLGTIATQDASSVAITGGSVTGITDITVADGGTGSSSHTAYSVICGGTTTSNPLQSVASVGTSGQVLTSNGAGLLPTFQNSSAGGITSYPSYELTTSNMAMLTSTIITTNSYGVTSLRLQFHPVWISQDITLNTVKFWVTGAAAGSQARVGIYEIDTSTLALTLIEDLGTVATTSTGTKSLAATSSLTASGRYFFAITVDENGGSVTLRATNNPQPFAFNTSTPLEVSNLIVDGVDPANPLSASYAWAALTQAYAGNILFFIT